MVLESILTPGLSHLSYLIGDASVGVAAMSDLRRDVEVYGERARAQAVRITHILEMHTHADLVSGSREFTDRTGLLEREGFPDVHTVPRSISAWKVAGYPMEGESSGA